MDKLGRYREERRPLWSAAMHAVFTAVPGHGHINPLVPLARALAGRGHSVTVVTGREMKSRVEELGFACVAAGPGIDEMQANALAVPEVRAAGATEPWKVAAAIFGFRAGAVIDDLAGTDLAPDLVVHDTYEMAGPLLAARAGVRWVSHGLGPRWPDYLEHHLGQLLAPLWSEHGCQPLERGGIGHHRYVEICPPTARSGDSVKTDPTIEARPVPLDEPATSEAFGPGARPKVYATLGTFSNRDTTAFRTLLGAMEGVEADVLLTVGATVELADLGPIPAHIRVERYVPQAQVIGRCDLVVCHGGSGTMLAALAAGVPAVVVPQGADQFRNAPFWAASGAAMVVPAEELTATSVASALQGSVEGGPLRQAAQAAAADIAAMASPEEVAHRLEALVPR
jgi:UDP:flavonoid glycosyltransferase YjiC (YdhE family)